MGRNSTVSELGPYLPRGLNRRRLTDRNVIRAISRVPRHYFVPAEASHLAYDDRALDIGEEQTISQPFIVALMTQEARIAEGRKVLEIGTGSGYQTAVLAELGAEVFTMEILPELARTAKARLEGLGYHGISYRCGDGSEGWPEEAPFDAILVAAAAPYPPAQLIEQLNDGGRLILPLEEPNPEREHLVLFEKKNGELTRRTLGSVRFVPLTGQLR